MLIMGGGIFKKYIKWGDGIKMGGGFGENNVKKSKKSNYKKQLTRK
jgi:hypothetical protein